MSLGGWKGQERRKKSNDGALGLGGVHRDGPVLYWQSVARDRIIHVTARDCLRQTFRSGGKGGQNQNKRDTGVRFIHPPSGARGESRDARTQRENEKRAWRRMAESPEFQRWIKVEHARRVGDIEAAVEEAMRPENLIVEFYDPQPSGVRAAHESPGGLVR